MLHTNNTHWIDELLKVLDRQQQLADQLAELAQQQQQLIDEQHTDALLTLLSKRQELVNSFLITQDQFTQLTTDIDQRLDALGSDQRNGIRGRIDQISTQLAAVMQTDEHDQQRLQSARGEIMREVEKVGASRQATSAYRVFATNAAKYTDRKG